MRIVGGCAAADSQARKFCTNLDQTSTNKVLDRAADRDAAYLKSLKQCIFGRQLISGAILALSDLCRNGFLDPGIQRRCWHDDNITSCQRRAAENLVAHHGDPGGL
jgi:hypothetical protein